MTSLAGLALVGAVAIGAAGGVVNARLGQEPPKPPVTPVASADAAGPAHFAGTWDYNADESVDAATGRREQGPRSAMARRGGGTSSTGPRTIPGAPGGPGGLGPGGYGGGGYGSGGFGGSGGGPDLIGMVYVNPMRELSRDLLEIPESLTIKIADGSITVIDDLKREQLYPTNGKKQKYQLGAAVYEAKVYWEGAQLKREIEGGEAFRLRETFFLSQDANRLFVILRVGDPPRQSDRNNPAPIHGFNRVYDRVREGAGGSGPGF